MEIWSCFGEIWKDFEEIRRFNNEIYLRFSKSEKQEKVFRKSEKEDEDWLL